MGAEAMDIVLGLRHVTAVSRTAVFGGPKCRGLRWCGLLEGEGRWAIACGDYRGGYCGAGGVVLVSVVTRYRCGGYGVGAGVVMSVEVRLTYRGLWCWGLL